MMAIRKKLKYPRKPKASASVATKERWLKRCNEIDKENSKREAENKRSKALTEKIRNRKRK